MPTHSLNGSCPPFLYVDRPELLGKAVDAVRGQARVAIDTEADSLHHYFEKLCLIQISTSDKHFLVDPLSSLDLTSLFEALTGPKLVLHGADYDLRLLRKTFGFTPVRIYDSAIAAQLLGYKAFGLAALVERHFGVVIPKSSQRADWSRRPLTNRMTEYAVNDTARLLELAELLDAELKELGRVEWRRQACQRLIEDSAVDRQVDPDSRWRIHGWRKLKGRQVPLLKALWEWREAEAQRADRPTFKILGNEPLLHLAVWADENPTKDLREFPRATRLFHGRRLEALKRAVKSALHLDPDEWPKPPVSRGTRPEPSVVQGMERLRKARNAAAEALNLDPGVLAPNWSLSAIAAASPDSEEELREAGRLLPWQAEAVGETFLEVLHHAGPTVVAPYSQSVAV